MAAKNRRRFGQGGAIRAPQEKIVAQAETYLRAHIDSTVPLRRVCSVVGLSERGLRNAFYRVRGMGPKQWILGERLQRVRSALKNGRGGPVTVSRVATDYGFFELGRFAGTYREAFGEVPSATLRGTRRNPYPEHTLNHEGDADVGTI